MKTTKDMIIYSYIPDHPYKMLITWSSGSIKTNALLNSIRAQDTNI